jgi:hypothetical protein
MKGGGLHPQGPLPIHRNTSIIIDDFASVLFKHGVRDALTLGMCI